MFGAIVGDVIGSRFEFHNTKRKDFSLFSPDCFPTDDSVMSLAVGKALIECNGDYSDLGEKTVHAMQTIGRKYPHCGFGGTFRKWVKSNDPKPYNSLGNGAAMRVSPCAFVAKSLEEAIELSRKVTEVTHNHPEGIKGAEATVVAVYMARTGSSIQEIRDYIHENYYLLDFSLDNIRSQYFFDVTCQGTVPPAIMAFLESTGFEDAIRNAISIGGDSDTIAAITGSIAAAFYGVPNDIRIHTMQYLDPFLTSLLDEFENACGAVPDKGIEGKKHCFAEGEVLKTGYKSEGYTEAVYWGYLPGTEKKLLLIKTGLGGSIYGYQGKYFHIAEHFNALGYHVLCCSSPRDISDRMSFDKAIETAKNLLGDAFEEVTIQYMGVSRGALQGILYNHTVPQIEKMLLINPPMKMSFPKLISALHALEKQTALVIGTKDPTFDLFPLLELIENPNLNLVEADGADHHFKGMDKEFFGLPIKVFLGNVVS